MGVTTITQEYTSPAISPSRMFKAIVLDAPNLYPKLLPQSFKSIQILQGDGGVGTISRTTFPEGSRLKYVKQVIDKLDKDAYECNHTLFEGDILGDILEKIVYETKFEAAGAGCVCKSTSHYHTKSGIELKEEDIKAGKEQGAGLYKAVEAYLIANPSAYA